MNNLYKQYYVIQQNTSVEGNKPQMSTSTRGILNCGVSR